MIRLIQLTQSKIMMSLNKIKSAWNQLLANSRRDDQPEYVHDQKVIGPKSTRPGALPHQLTEYDVVAPIDADNFRSTMMKISGGITIEEAEFLREMAQEVQDGCIVEVGSFRGKSSVALSAGAMNSGKQVSVFCIEPHQDFVGVYGGEFGPIDRKEFFRVMLATGAYENTSLVNLSSEDVSDNWTRPVALCFIDGDHTLDGVKRDFQCWAPHILVGGVVIFDDALDPEIGPAQFLDELLPSGNWEQLPSKGKFVALRKLPGKIVAQSKPVRILVPCNNIVLRGGLIRFDRIAREISKNNHELFFLPLGEQNNYSFPPFAKSLTLDQAKLQSWDAVMIPGAGFPMHVIELFKEFKNKKFGVRIQHILNDTTHYETFEMINRFFKPDRVIFNNSHWPVGSYTRFHAKQFHFLEGAVDIKSFTSNLKEVLFGNESIVLGGLANKNPEPLIEALRILPPTVKLNLFGSVDGSLVADNNDLVEAGRLTFTGALLPSQLNEYYQCVDIVVATELFAGWCNLGAEALASGIPLVCTKFGTLAYAENKVTALVVESPTPHEIRDSVEELIRDREKTNLMVRRGLDKIRAFDWSTYTKELLKLVRNAPEHHYYRHEELELYGKWSVADRFEGLEPIFELCAGKTVIDLGAAEGLVGLTCLKRGAKTLIGFEIDAKRVMAANRFLQKNTALEEQAFYQGDLSDWSSFLSKNKSLLEAQYDIVLYLGIHQHLGSQECRLSSLLGALVMTKEYIAIRTPQQFYIEDEIDSVIENAGFTLLNQTNRDGAGSYLGGTRLYRRIQVQTE